MAEAGYELVRAHPYKPDEKHGFIGSQKEGMKFFAASTPSAPLIVAEAVWQYSHHVLHGLITHEGPILTVANWSGTWPGLVGMLNLNGSLTKAGVKYSTLWSEDFTDELFLDNLRRWLEKGNVQAQDRPRHAAGKTSRSPRKRPQAGQGAGRPAAAARRPSWASSTKAAWACSTRSFPITCSTRPASIKERLSQSALYYETTQVSDDEATRRPPLDGRARHEVRHRPEPRRAI